MNFLLEQGRIEDIPRSKEAFQRLLKFHWEYYTELAFQRSQIYELLKASLSERAKPFEFSRCLSYFFSMAARRSASSL